MVNPGFLNRQINQSLYPPNEANPSGFDSKYPLDAASLALPIYPRILQTFLLHGQEAFPVPNNFLIIV